MGPIPESLPAFLARGPSIIVGTRSADLVPNATQAVGLTVAPDLARVTLYLADQPAARALADLAVAPVVAITVSEPATLRTLQLKGDVRAIRAARARERSTLDAYRERLADQLSFVGVPRRFIRRLANWPAHAVEVEVTALFEQTPGPGAGAPLPGGGPRL